MVDEGCVDVAHHIAASERWEAPDTNAAAFFVLAALDELDDLRAFVAQVSTWMVTLR